MKDKGIFRFKKFSVKHHNSTMKIGTDAVLLGSWVRSVDRQHILDIGTGCGVIAMMLAQTNTNANVIGIDIDLESVKEATENATHSPWAERIEIIQSSLQEYVSKSPFDLIVSNPPFFEEGTFSPINARKNARHSTQLNYTALVENTDRLLSENGEFAIILPHNSQSKFIKETEKHKFYLQRITYFKPSKDSKVERVLMAFSKKFSSVQENTLIHYDQNGDWTVDYIRLTKDFYLKL